MFPLFYLMFCVCGWFKQHCLAKVRRIGLLHGAINVHRLLPITTHKHTHSRRDRLHGSMDHLLHVHMLTCSIVLQTLQYTGWRSTASFGHYSVAQC